MSEKIIIDPEIKSLIPPLEKEEREQLQANLKRDGCRDKLTGWKGHGILLDGHNRYEICERLGIGYQVEWKEFASRSAAIVWVIENQFGRRNLNDFQRAELALKLKNAIADEAESRMKKGEGSNPSVNLREGRTDEKLAVISGVSASSVNRVEKIQRDAEPEIAEMARKGDVSIDAAAKVATLPRSAQKAVAAAGPKAVKEKAKQIREGKTEADAEPPVLDGRGEVVTDPKLIPIFRDAAERFDGALSLLRQVSALVNPLLTDDKTKGLPAGRWLGPNDWRITLKNLRNFLNGTRPYAPCPYPHGEKKCEACKGLGFVIQSTWDVAPREYKSRGGKGKK